MLLPQVGDKLLNLSEKLSVNVLTADTFGEVRKNFASFPFEVQIIKTGDEIKQKIKFVERLRAEKVIAFGNGYNDMEVLKTSGIGISILESEGAHTKSLFTADLCVGDICEGTDLLLNPLRLVTSLRF
jgi:soluble P-type ATPase